MFHPVPVARDPVLPPPDTRRSSSAPLLLPASCPLRHRPPGDAAVAHRTGRCAPSPPLLLAPAIRVLRRSLNREGVGRSRGKLSKYLIYTLGNNKNEILHWK
jgi:hypothetical protein